MRLLSIACVCITLACLGYLVFDLSRSTHVKILHFAPKQESLPHPAESTPAIQVRPFQSPASRQLTNTNCGTMFPDPLNLAAGEIGKIQYGP
jgi:hypothetical protein